VSRKRMGARDDMQEAVRLLGVLISGFGPQGG
jgi:hypothetical protein